jgi:phage shock protein C
MTAVSDRPTERIEPGPQPEPERQPEPQGEPEDTRVEEEPAPAEPQPAEPQTAVDAGVAPEPPPAPPATASRRLYRSRDDRVIAGVCGGLGEYFGIDAVLMRIAFVLLVFAGGLGILAYVLGWIFIPEEPAGAPSVGVSSQTEPAVAERQRRTGAIVLGLIFVALGVLYLFDVAWPNLLSWRYLWPIALIAVGAAILLRARP